MISHTYATDAQTKSTELASAILAASSPPQIAAACGAIESFLQHHTPDQARWFFSITFPNLICKVFGFDESAAQRPQSLAGWIDVVSASNDPELAGRVFGLLSPDGVLMSSISAVDRLSLVKYVFPVERLPEWARFMLQHERDCRILADLCPLFKGRVKEDPIKASSFQVQLNVFEYYMFWFAYYPVCRGNSEQLDAVRVRRSKKFRLENWTSSIPVFSSSRRGPEQKTECSLYLHLLYAFLRSFVPICDLNAHQPYRSSLLHYSSGHDNSIVERAEFLVNTLIHFWLVDNDFSPLSVNVSKSFGVSFPFRSVLSDLPPTSGLGEVVNVFVKYLNLSPLAVPEGSEQFEYKGSPGYRVAGPADAMKLRNCVTVFPGGPTVGCWNPLIQRSLYRYILRTFLFCPVETSIKNASQVFSVWVSYIEPWAVSLQDFADLDANVVMSSKNSKEVDHSPKHGYSSSWQGFVLSNYLFYSSLLMHFFGFAHKFLHTDAEMIVRMVSKVVSILTSSEELTDLVKNVDAVFHSKESISSKSNLYSLCRFVPSLREQLQDWEDGLCETDADGSFLHENWNRDLRLFSDGEDGGKHLLQLFVLRSESELMSISGDNVAKNLQCLDTLKAQMGHLFGGPVAEPFPPTPQTRHHQSRDDIFKPRRAGNSISPEVKYKGDWMKRPISSDEVACLVKPMVNLSGWLNKSLGLNQSESNYAGPTCSYVDVSSDANNVCGPKETMKVVALSLVTWLITSCGMTLRFMREHGLRVNLRMLASKKVVAVLLLIATFNMLKRTLQSLKQ